MRFTKSSRATRRGAAAPFSFISRRLRTSGSVKGGKGSSTFFSISGKKRGGGFESREPSSPKVTCIGQVRVKSKKRVKQCRRRIGEVSFRTAEQSNGGGVQPAEDKDKVWLRSQRLSNSSAHSHREQRWVHLPVSVCEALRAFRDEICCFFPCGCSCFSRREREKSSESGYYSNEHGCGAALSRWLVAVNGGEEGGKRREIEVVVGGEERAEMNPMMSFKSSRRHFDDIEVIDDRIEVKGRTFAGEDEDNDEEEARLSICIPPKNALLLMRCRSDPMKMVSLTHRFSFEAPKHEVNDVEEADNDNAGVDFEQVRGSIDGKLDEILVGEVDQVVEQEDEPNLKMEEVGGNECEEQAIEEREESDQELVETIDESNVSSFEDVLHTLNVSESAESGEEIRKEKEEETEDVSEVDETEERESAIEHEDEEDPNPPEPTESQIEENPKNQEMAIINKPSGLPECLLLMMCEPKLSMEVSKETWVRGTDFIRLLPERPRKPAKTTATAAAGGGDHEPVKRRPSIDSKSRPRVPAPPTKKNALQPARSSCSLPVASMAAAIERNQVSVRKCEPFSLTRCKSEPMSTAAAKLMPESCSWNNNAGMQLEPHRQAALGVGAAGVGF